ncbi:uncharacterized protein LOC142743168 [Rhinoderma darwinii]|uniref:uncharacterized protein LOC142743168 n=1 Tax=Rhinoderma darwinii TaxID=43563 RepID=UPI003F66D1FC
MVKTGKDKLKDTHHTPKKHKNQHEVDRFFNKKHSTLSFAGSNPSAYEEDTEMSEDGDSDRESSTAQTTTYEDSDACHISRAFLKKCLAQALSPVLKELSDIKMDVKHIGNRVDELENVHAALLSHSTVTQQAVVSQQEHLNAAFLQLEDQEKRNRRKNIRLRGIPESVTPEALKAAAVSIFTDLLGVERASQVVIERIHRALRPKPAPGEPPRNVVCGLLSFVDTAALLQKARDSQGIYYDKCITTNVKSCFSKMSQQARRILKPLTDILRDRHIPYRWLYPFGLSVMINGKPLMVRQPADLQKIWTVLQVNPLDIPSWLPVHLPTSFPELPPSDGWSLQTKVKSPRRTPT